MKVYVISDTHWGHSALHDIFRERPEDFGRRITAEWWNAVSDDDLVVHLGDVHFGKVAEWSALVPSLPGRKVLVLGNHDKRSVLWYMKNGFEFCCSSFQWEMFGLQIHFTHEPVTDGTFDLNIHGHLHDGKHRECEYDERQFLVSLETSKYRPLQLESIIKMWKKSRA